MAHALRQHPCLALVSQEPYHLGTYQYGDYLLRAIERLKAIAIRSLRSPCHRTQHKPLCFLQHDLSTAAPRAARHTGRPLSLWDIQALQLQCAHTPGRFTLQLLVLINRSTSIILAALAQRLAQNANLG